MDTDILRCSGTEGCEENKFAHSSTCPEPDEGVGTVKLIFLN
jgi:hypothetical protein